MMAENWHTDCKLREAIPEPQDRDAQGNPSWRKDAAHVSRARASPTTRAGMRTSRHLRLAMPLVAAALAAALPACSATQSDNGGQSQGSSGPPTTQLGSKSGPDDATTPTDGGQLEFGIEAEPEGL